MKNSLLLLILTAYVSSTIYSQNSSDSLLSVYLNAQNDSNRINALHQFVKTNYSTPDSAIKYAQFAVEFSKNIKNDNWLAKSYNLLAISYYYQGDLIKSKKNLYESLNFYSKLKDESGTATCYNGIGVVNYDQGKLYEALEYFIKSMRIKQKTDDTTSIAMTLNNIGNVYKDLNKFEKSLEYYNKSIELKEKIDDKHGLAMTLNNIGLLYHNYKKYNEAKDYYDKSLAIKTEIDDKHGLAMTLNNIGLNYEVQKDYKRALDFYLQSVKIRDQINDKYGLAMTLINIATVYRDIGEYSKTYSFLFKAEKISNEIGATTQLRDCYQRLYETYEKQGNVGSAYKYFKLFEATKDSIMNEESLKNIQKLNAKYENEKQLLEIQNLSKKDELNAAQLEKSKAELKSKRILNFSLIVGLILSAVLVIFLSITSKQRKKQEEKLKQALEEKDVLFKEVQHRVKNNFQLISSLLNLHLNNTENEAAQKALSEAKDRIVSMAMVHEKLYKSTDLSNINIKDYIKDLVIYLLENAEEEIDAEINVDEVEINIETVIPLGLILNELVTNSIKYAFKWDEEKKIKVDITRAGDKLKVEYTDNGPGLPDGFDINNIESLGLNLVQILVLQLHGQLQVENEKAKYFFEFTIAS